MVVSLALPPSPPTRGLAALPRWMAGEALGPGIGLGTEGALGSMPAEAGSPDDATLLRGIAQGQREAFHDFYERHAGRVVAYSRQLAGGEALEDVVQEVFLAVWRKAASYQADRGDVAGWLYTITRNKLFDLWRRQGRSPAAGSFDLQALAGGARGVPSELRLSLEQALGRLRADQRQAVEMAYFGGLTYEETAERLQLPVGTLKSRIRSALHAMRATLEEA